MKYILLISSFFIFLASSYGQKTKKLNSLTVQISCGQCNFNMEGNSCDLAIKHNRRSYFVDGSSIDDHGDAHATDGFCTTIREAVVTGQIKNRRFIASKIELLPTTQEKK